MKPLLTSDELAEILKVDVVTIRRLVNRQEIAAYRVGNEFRFTESDLEGYLQRQRLPARDENNDLFGRLSSFIQKIMGGGNKGLKFTRRVFNVFKLAQKAALGLGHNYIGTEHLLLGLLKEGGGIAALVLREQGVSYEQAYERVGAILGKEEPLTRKELNLTPRAKKVIEQALEEAQRLNHTFLGTEHMLLGILSEGEGVACSVLKEALDEEKYARLRDEVLRKVETEGAREEMPSISDKANAFINAQGEGRPCVHCGALCLDTFNYCFNCGTHLENK